VSLELDGLSLLCFHGSPGSYNDVIVATTPDERLGELFAGRNATVMLGGHTHTQLLRRFQSVAFVNPGSVGSPYELLSSGEARNPAWAEYALIKVVRGQPSITFQRIPYDVTPVLEAAERRKMPHAAWWSADWSR
jgi:predicted phosphodiesterase